MAGTLNMDSPYWPVRMKAIVDAKRKALAEEKARQKKLETLCKKHQKEYMQKLSANTDYG